MSAKDLGVCLMVPLLSVASLAATGSSARVVDAVKKGDKVAVRALLRKHADVNLPEADGTTAVHWAAFNDDVETAGLLIAAGADVKAANAFGVTPLTIACTNANPAMVDTLLKAGADPNARVGQNETALMTASRTGSASAVAVLIAHGADVNATNQSGQTALMFAAAEGHSAIVKALLAAKADLHARTNTAVRARGMAVTRNGNVAAPATPAARTANAAISGSTNVVPGSPNPNNGRPVVDIGASMGSPAPRSGGLTPLMFAVREGQLDTVRTLIEAGADPNETLPDGSSALVLAATNANYEIGIYLVDKGADPNAAENGWTALHALTWVRHPNFGFNPPGPVIGGNMDSLAFAKALVARGANVNARITKEVTNGYRNALNRIGATPLLMAARLADALLMRVLVQLGADPKIPTEDNTMVLMVAAGVGIHSPGEDPGTDEEALECVQYALELGGDPNAADDNDDTPLHGAAYRGAPAIVQLLVDHGAKTFDKKNIYGWTPLRIADGIFRTATYKESAPTAALLRQLMAKQSAGAAANPQSPR